MPTLKAGLKLSINREYLGTRRAIQHMTGIQPIELSLLRTGAGPKTQRILETGQNGSNIGSPSYPDSLPFRCT